LFEQFEKRIDLLRDGDACLLLQDGLIGLEKESLRVEHQGSISQKPHPTGLGSALTNPYVTTDYSEALLEFTTPPNRDVATTLSFLRESHQFVYQNLEDELLWATSMPCVVKGEAGIPIACYGDSNQGMMKTIYRRGLGYRYGRVMQVIAGVHFNYSIPEAFWPIYQELLGDSAPLQDFINRQYMAMVRNLQRFGWLVPYLFGASPAVCKSFLCGRGSSTLQPFDETTYFEPFATSLRMGDIGYQNTREEGVGIKANYDSLESYIASLRCAIETPSEEWAEIGVVVNGEWRQLNANLLQIENEYYSTVRPKQPPAGMEKPVVALGKRGIRYVELRSLDVNAYDPLGVSEPQLRFVEAFMIFSMLCESPLIGQRERRFIDRNLITTAHRGRDPALTLQCGEGDMKLRDWAGMILDAMEPVCDFLDVGNPDGVHTATLAIQKIKVDDPEKTPSARMLAEMRREGEGFYTFARRMSQLHKRYFDSQPLCPERMAFHAEAAKRSLDDQREMEAGEKRSFPEFLQRYFGEKA